MTEIRADLIAKQSQELGEQDNTIRRFRAAMETIAQSAPQNLDAPMLRAIASQALAANASSTAKQR